MHATLQISLANWNQDEEFGGFGPPHCMVKGGYSTLTDALAKQVDVRLGQPVKRIAYNGQGVTVSTAAGEGCGSLDVFSGGFSGAVLFYSGWHSNVVLKLGSL